MEKRIESLQYVIHRLDEEIKMGDSVIARIEEGMNSYPDYALHEKEKLMRLKAVRERKVAHLKTLSDMLEEMLK